MKEEKKQKNKYDVHMTDEERNRVWDGVLRRASDFPDGKSPFADKPSNWDGTLRRASDFPEGGAPASLSSAGKAEDKEGEE
jgi:hypothetical protein